ncbi:MAG TPA: extracellular solute-binding protein [Candidatus Saccharimonadales bacterium]|nr:extracellular solute-binding protein [Candidatus Saccharimonadales bacterium]
MTPRPRRGDCPPGRRSIPLVVLAECWGFLFAAATAIPIAAAPSVVVLTPHVDAIRSEFGAGFAAWHEQVHGEPALVDWRNVGGTSDALRFLRSEFANKPDGVGVDILFGGGQEPFLVLVEQKFAAPHEPPADILQGIPQRLGGMELYDPGFRWFAATLSSFGILQNTRLQRLLGLSLARRWDDLGRPEVFGWVGAGDPRNSGTMTVMYESFLQASGWEKGWRQLARLGGNVRKFDRGSSSTAKDVTFGETAYALAIDFYGISQIAVAGRSNMTFVLPEDFTAISADCIGMLKGAPHPVTAGRFIDFVLSEAGQRLWFLPQGHAQGPRRFSLERMSIRPDFYKRYAGDTKLEFSPFDLKQPFVYDSKLAESRREVVAGLVGALLVDTHEELRAAWQALLRRGLPEADLVELGRMPLGEQAALELARGPWRDPAVRNRRKIEWQKWAQAKYRKLCASSSKT